MKHLASMLNSFVTLHRKLKKIIGQNILECVPGENGTGHRCCSFHYQLWNVRFGQADSPRAHSPPSRKQAQNLHWPGHTGAWSGSTEHIRHKENVCLSIHVVSGVGPNLLGRDLITALEVNLQDLEQIRSLDLSSPLNTLLDKHSKLFQQ